MNIVVRTDLPDITIRVQQSRTSSPSGEPMVWLTINDPGSMLQTVWLTKLQAQTLAAALNLAVDTEVTA